MFAVFYIATDLTPSLFNLTMFAFFWMTDVTDGMLQKEVLNHYTQKGSKY